MLYRRKIRNITQIMAIFQWDTLLHLTCSLTKSANYIGASETLPKENIGNLSELQKPFLHRRQDY